MSEPIRIDVWSDIACPWCYIGKRNLERGLAEVAEDEDAPRVQIEYHSFQLAPETPTDFAGNDVDYLTQFKGVSRDAAEQMSARVSAVAADAGLDYRLDLLQHTNTLKAHQLLHYAKEHGLQRELKERLMSAYFIEGRHLGRDDELVALAREVGLDAAGARAALSSEQYLAAVRSDQEQAAAYGIQGVPFFVIDGKYGVSGAQPAEAFAQIARQLWAERAEAARAD